ncbi:hypothetical protein BGZ61DRAFT_530131 [Ilyonectria robusta]|uniref:uncharacterized protein n=1 Tax=Ilyonectria robusta TaxID=1079257 RepID=UPI001E8D09AC|nr:uncharacterized protein BGZ61DRAFT_530131 [Ilyonectria robusta]KAH8721599.1 hypothetical protein BGZ61DRAFT_530131 [Ilyonectria robusta]
MPDRGPLYVPPSTEAYPSRDKSFRQDFAAPLAKNNSQLNYPGYRRALELYGNESVLLGAQKAHHFRRWIRQNGALHRSYRVRAESEGFNPDQGFVELLGDQALYHYYHPTDPRNRTSATSATYPAEQEILPPSTPLPNRRVTSTSPSTTRSTRRRLEPIIVEDSDSDNMAPSTNNRDNRGRFTTGLPEALTRMDGLRVPNENDLAGTCVGSAELYSILAELLERQYAAKSTGEVDAL